MSVNVNEMPKLGFGLMRLPETDGKIDINDATMVQKAAAEIATLTASQSIAADVNRDGNIDVTDVTLIQKYAAEIIDHF